MSKNTLVLIVVAIVAIIGAVYYLQSGQDAMTGQESMGVDTQQAVGDTVNSESGQTNMAPNPSPSSGSPSTGASTGASVNAEVSDISASMDGEAAQANAENGTESATQLNSTLDNQPVYAE